jgi:hypothetical protein
MASWLIHVAATRHTLLSPRVPFAAFSPRLKTFATVSNIPPAKMTIQQHKKQYKNFDLVDRVDLHFAPGMSVEKWKSRVTGLTVYWANFPSE